MSRWSGLVSRAVLVAALVISGAGVAHAQGVTTSALSGVVTQQPSGEPLPEARLVLRSGETGITYTGKTNSLGRFLFDNVPPGSNYSLQVSAIGFKGVQVTGILLTLGSRVTRNVGLEPQVVQLEEVQAVAYDESPLINAAKTGPSMVLTDTVIQRLPLVTRNFTDLIQTTPQVVGTSVAGQNSRFNNIQIDGGVNNDVFAIGSSGTPGGQSNGKAISVEAIKEFQVLVAPFDVRQGSFSGGLVNGITLSGTNTFHGSAFGYHQAKDMTGFRDDPTYTDLSIWQYGGTLGGPIVKDKAWFFGAVDIQSRAAPFFSTLNLTGDDAFDISNVGFTLDQAQQVSNILTNTYGTPDLGNGTTPSIDNPLANVFGKLSFNIAGSSLLDISYNYAKAELGQLVRSVSRPGNLPSSGFLTAANMRDGYELTQSGYGQNNHSHTIRAQLRSELGNGFSNEFLAGYQIIRDARDFNGLPLFLVRGGRAANVDGWIAAGGDRFSQANSLDQDIFSMTENLSFGTGAHRVTVGASGDFFNFNNVFFEGSIGVWQFNSIDSLQNAQPAAFLRNLPAPGRPGGVASFSAKLFGLYAQDRWTINDRLNVTAGLRVDLPLNDKPLANPALINDPTLPINTSDFPSGNLMWSPRLGFNWSLDQYENTVFRGGVGYFSGRPPYVWISNGFVNTGAETVTLYCTGATRVPTFNVDPATQPTTCADGTPASSGAATINYFDKDLKFPQNFRVSLGLDRRLPYGLVGTFDFLYSKNVNQFYLQDANLSQTGTDAQGRAIYGTLGANGTNTALVSTPSRLTPAVTSAIGHTNTSGGRTFSTTFQLQKAFGNNFALNAAYTYSNTTDQFSMTSSIAFSNYQFGAVDGRLQDRNVTTSFFDVPHKVTLSGTVNLPYHFEFSLIYVGRSGDPYAWMVGSDVNADGISGNDLPFIPGDPGEISLSPTSSYDDLQAFISSQKCLVNSRGKMLERNSCRNPWQNITSARIGWVTPAVKGQTVELTLDLFNVLAFLGSDWGQTKQVSAFEEGPALLRAAGYDAINQRPIYSFTTPQVVETVVLGEGLNSSRWRMQLGAKYRF